MQNKSYVFNSLTYEIKLVLENQCFLEKNSNPFLAH